MIDYSLLEETAERVLELSNEIHAEQEYKKISLDMRLETLDSNPVIKRYLDSIDLEKTNYELIDQELTKIELFLDSKYCKVYSACVKSNDKKQMLEQLIKRDFSTVESLDSELYKIMSLKETSEDSSYYLCSNCGSSKTFIDEKRGEHTCRNCGLVDDHKKEPVEQDRRAFTVDEVKNRRKTEPVWRHFGPRTMIGGCTIDCKGNKLKPGKTALFARLGKIQGSLVTSLERNYWEAKPKLEYLSHELGIPQYVSETAWKIYEEVAKQRLTMGRSITSFVVASLYAAIRINKLPRTLDEVCSQVVESRRSIHRSLGLILSQVLPKVGYKYQILEPKILVFRFGQTLDISLKIQNEAAAIIGKISNIAEDKNHPKLKEAKALYSGRDPKGLAAAALYIAAKQYYYEKKTQTDLAEAADITEVTLRTDANKIKKLLKYEENEQKK